MKKKIHIHNINGIQVEVVDDPAPGLKLTFGRIVTRSIYISDSTTGWFDFTTSDGRRYTVWSTGTTALRNSKLDSRLQIILERSGSVNITDFGGIVEEALESLGVSMKEFETAISCTILAKAIKE